MTDPIVGKTISQLRSPAQDPLAKVTPDKQVPSQFDSVRDQTAQTPAQAPGPNQLPPPVTQISADDRKKIEGQLRRRLDVASSSATPQQVFKPDMKATQVKLQTLTQKVSRVPNSPAYDPVRQRLSDIEKQFQDSGKLLDNIPSLDNHRDLLKLQMGMYQITQNIEIMSKVVDSMSSGVKQVLQTQI